MSRPDTFESIAIAGERASVRLIRVQINSRFEGCLEYETQLVVSFRCNMSG